MKRHLLLALIVAAPVVLPTTALAQGIDDLDEEEDSGDRGRERTERTKEVREITKGFYVKSNVGAGMFLGNFRGFVKPGSSVALSVGQDFLDQEKSSAAWEVSFTQGIHNGCGIENQLALACAANAGGARPSPFVQGDLRTYTLSAAAEFSTYPARRFGIGIRAGAGGMISPLLIHEETYVTEILPDIQRANGGIDPNYHGPLKIMAFGGPTFEYYSKLAHFSIGADVDVFYALSFDLGMNATGYLKYTF